MTWSFKCAAVFDMRRLLHERQMRWEGCAPPASGLTEHGSGSSPEDSHIAGAKSFATAASRGQGGHA
jgi:hypothetical protein